MVTQQIQPRILVHGTKGSWNQTQTSITTMFGGVGVSLRPRSPKNDL